MNVPVLNIRGQDYNVKDTQARIQTAGLNNNFEQSKQKSGYLSRAILVNAGSTHSSENDKMECNLIQGKRYFYTLKSSEGVTGTEMRVFYSDGTNEVVNRTADGNIINEQLFPSKNIIAVGMYISNGGQNASITMLSVWDTIQIPQDHYQNEMAYVGTNGYVTMQATSAGGLEITISDTIVVIYGTNQTEKNKASMLSEIGGAVESGNGVKFTILGHEALVYNCLTGLLYIRDRSAIRPGEINLITANYGGVCSGLLLHKYYQKLIGDNALNIEEAQQDIAHIEDIITGNIEHTSTATIPAGAVEGVWLTLNGTNKPIKISCNTDLITKYRIYKTDDSFDEFDVGEIYFVDNIRGTVFQVQLPYAYMKKEDGVVVGGDVSFVWEYQEDEIFKNNSIYGSSLKDGTTDYEKLSSNARFKLYEDTQTIPMESFADEEIGIVSGKLDLIQTQNTSSIAFVTDLHFLVYSAPNDYWRKMFERVGKSIKKLDTKNMIDFTVLGGDYLWNNGNTTKALAKEGYTALQKAFYPLKDKMFALKGNHDDNSIAYQGGQPVTAVVLPNEEYRYLGKQYEKSGAIFEVGDHNLYGYYDIPSQKIRCIFVNTGDLPYNISGGTLDYGAQHIAAIRQRQSEFIQNALMFDEEGWSVVFFSHHPLVACDVSGSNRENYCPDIWEIIKAYKNKTTYSGTITNEVSSYNVNVDYTNNRSNDIIACICGHVHDDRDDVVDDILVVSTTTACPGMIDHIQNTADETSYDIFTINKEEKKLYATRYGMGNDRLWTYGT